MLGIKAALGKIEVDNIKERVDMGRRARLEKGEMLGSLRQLRYGYKKVERPPEIEEAEAEIIHKIYSWYIAGENNMEIWNESSPVKLTPPGNYALVWRTSRLTSLARRLFRWPPGRKPRRSEPAIAMSHAGSRKITYVLGWFTAPVVGNVMPGAGERIGTKRDAIPSVAIMLAPDAAVFRKLYPQTAPHAQAPKKWMITFGTSSRKFVSGPKCYKRPLPNGSVSWRWNRPISGPKWSGCKSSSTNWA